MPPAIATPRLSLEVLRPDVIRLLLAGEIAAAERALAAPLPADFAATRHYWLRRHLSLQQRYPAREGWSARLAFDAGHTAVGHCGFHGPPEAVGRAEIGYTVFEPFRGRGYAKELAAGLIGWALAEGEREIFASVSPENAPSLAVVRSLGFKQVGVQEDPVDGTELVFTVTADSFTPPA